jgi:hypothetical protein
MVVQDSISLATRFTASVATWYGQLYGSDSLQPALLVGSRREESRQDAGAPTEDGYQGEEYHDDKTGAPSDTADRMLSGGYPYVFLWSGEGSSRKSADAHRRLCAYDGE